jgi:hypothetical protein
MNSKPASCKAFEQVVRMPSRRIFFVLACLLTSAFAESATQRALLIGVSNYEANLPALAGSRNDVLIIRKLLVQKFGFDPSNIRTLVDEQATRAGIVSAVIELSEQSAPDDIVLIHFSGHGSQAPDTNGDEDDGLDETILPYDSRTPGIADITDDDINALISKIPSRSVIVILDSCHSGTGTRSGPAQVSQRWVAPDTRRELYETIQTRQVLTLPVSESHVLFSAAQDFQSELDGPFGPNNMRLGLFTAALVGALADAPVTVSPRQAIEGVNANVETLRASAAGMPIPEPNLEAPLEKQELPMFVFSDAAPETEPADGAAGLAVGNKPEFAHTRAIFVTTNGTSQPELAHEIARSVENELVVSETLETADAVIDVVERDTYDIYGPGGVVRVAHKLTDAAAATAENKFDFLRPILLSAPSLADLVSLQTPPSGFHFLLKAADVSAVTSQAVSTRAIKVTANTANKKLRFYRTGQPRTKENSLQLHVESSEDCYLTIAAIDSFGQVYLLLPNAGQQQSGFLGPGRIRANQAVLIPDSLEPDNLAGFYFDYAPPGGTDRVIGVCMVELQDAQRLRNQLTELERGALISQELFNESARAQDRKGPDEGGLGSKSGAGWAASVLTIEVGR